MAFPSVLQNLHKPFNGTITLTAFVQSFPVEPDIFCLYLTNYYYQDN